MTANPFFILIHLQGDGKHLHNIINIKVVVASVMCTCQLWLSLYRLFVLIMFQCKHLVFMTTFRGLCGLLCPFFIVVAFY